MNSLLENLNLSDHQISRIEWFMKNPPKYYKWFYRFYTKYIGKIIFISIILCGILMIIHNHINADIFNIILGFFFFAAGLGLWALSAFLYKHFYTKRFAKKELGVTLNEWNGITHGLSWDI